MSNDRRTTASGMIMAKEVRGPVLTPEALRDGYIKAVEQGFALLDSAMGLAPKQPAIALGLAELGQEEVGKSLSLLAAMALPRDADSMQWFWRSWKDHRLKAHRAFLYELISPTRVEIHDPAGGRLAVASLRAAIHHEKEAAFYVDFDRTTGGFTRPTDCVTPRECMHRVITLMYLAITADRVRAALEETADLGSYSLFAEIALGICSEDLYQQQMPDLLQEFSRRSPSHARVDAVLTRSLAEGRQFLEELLAQHGDAAEEKDAQPER